MIECSNLEKSFGDIKVLKDINLKIDKGEIYGLIGRSGSGKSTFLRCVNGLEKYDNGTLKVNGAEVKNYHKKEVRGFRKNIGMIFQNFSLMSRKTVYENIALPMECWKYKKKEIDKRVKELLELVGIEDKIDEKPKSLSGGQKQRVAIARALALNPEMLLCDEATSALDPKTTKSILALLRDINEKLGITILIVTHEMAVIREICTKVGILEDGQLLTKGDVEEIFLEQPQALINLLGDEKPILPTEGTNIMVFYRKKDFTMNFISNMARTLNVDFSIVGGNLEKYRDGVLGTITINTEEKNVDLITDYYTGNNVKWKVIDNG